MFLFDYLLVVLSIHYKNKAKATSDHHRNFIPLRLVVLRLSILRKGWIYMHFSKREIYLNENKEIMFDNLTPDEALKNIIVQ